MSPRFLWFFLVLLFVILDRSEGWRRRRRRRCPVTNCDVSYWSSWSSCTAACGWGGTQWRSRSVTRGPSCGGSCPYALSQSQGCNRFCYNGGTPQQSWCNCKIGYSGQCCKGGKHLATPSFGSIHERYDHASTRYHFHPETKRQPLFKLATPF